MRWSRRKPVSRKDLLEAKPFRNSVVTWEMKETQVRLQVPRNDRRTVAWLARLFPLPESRTIDLDEVGSEVWWLCDGERTVKEIVGALASGHRLDRKEAEMALIEYLRTLTKRGLVGLDAGSQKTKE